MSDDRIGAWDLNLGDEFLKLSERAMVKKKLEVITYLLTRIIQRSPVDTGAFRGSHRVSVGAVDNSSKGAIDTGGTSTIAAGISAASAASALDSIYIQSNLPYAKVLEYGHSRQAPRGIYKLSLKDTKAKFNELL